MCWFLWINKPVKTRHRVIISVDCVHQWRSHGHGQCIVNTVPMGILMKSTNSFTLYRVAAPLQRAAAVASGRDGDVTFDDAMVALGARGGLGPASAGATKVRPRAGYGARHQPGRRTPRIQPIRTCKTPSHCFNIPYRLTYILTFLSPILNSVFWNTLRIEVDKTTDIRC